MTPPSPEEVLRALPAGAAPLVAQLLAAADARDDAVHLVGGPVRDLLLGRPVVDVDLVVEGRNAEGAPELARAAFPAERVVVHDRFGTVTVRSDEGAVDVATARRETYSHHGALPSVEAGSLEDDLRRRDFSVNALALPLSRAARKRHPQVIDLDEGLRDLEAARLRILHPTSFHDDPTRALRAARLAPRLGFSLTRGSRTALRDALRDGAFGHVSGDRLRRELQKLFSDARAGLDPSRALRLLSDWHVLGALEPGLALERDAVLPLRRLGRALAEPPWKTTRFRPEVGGLMLWLAPLAPALRRRALGRFSVRGDAARRIGVFPAARDRALRSLGRARGRGAVDALLRDLPEEELLAVFASAPSGLRSRIVRYAGEDRARRPPVNGTDLLEIGFSGAAVGRALARIRSAFLDGAVKDREEALALARELARRGAARR